MTRTHFRLLAAGAALLAATGTASAKDLVYGTGTGARSTTVEDADVPVLNALSKASGGSMDWKVYAGGQIVKLENTLTGLRDGVVDAGFVVPVFTRKELKNVNVVYDTQVFGEDAVAVSAAVDETIQFDCPQCLADYKRFDSIHLASYGNEPYGLICRKDVKTVADVKGLKIRAVGAGTRLMAALGAVPVSMSPPDATTALQRGALDCVHGVLAWLKNFGYWDVASSFTQTFLGSPRALGAFVIGRRAWDPLSMKDKKLIISYMPKLLGALVFVADRKGDEDVKAAATKKGVSFHPGGKDFAQALDAFRVHERKTLVATQKKLGAKNPQQILDAYEKNYAKWEKIVQTEVKGDQAAYEKALWREIYSKLDPAKM